MGTGEPADASLIAPSEDRLAYKWLALTATSSGSLLATVSSSIVTIALPSIAASFTTSLATAQWVVVIYPLFTVSIMIAVGYLGDRVGRKAIFTAGAIVFAIGSLLCGLAQDPWALIAFRALQAVGGAMVVANSAAIITAAFPARERGKAIGIQVTIAGIGLSIGPSLGGILVDSAGWRSVFFVAVPLSIVTALLSLLFLRDTPRSTAKSPPFDLIGTLTLFISLSAFLLALSEGQENGWLTSRTIALAAIFVIATITFLRVESVAALPAVDLSLLRHRLFGACAGSGLAAYILMFAVTFLMPFYLTETAGYSHKEAGVLLSSVPLAMAATAALSGWLSDRFGSRWLCSAGIGISIVGVLLLVPLGRTASIAEITVPLVLVGFGLGTFITPNNSTMMGCAPSGRLGMASGMVATVRHLAVALGVAAASVIFTTRLAVHAVPGAETANRLFDPAASVGAFHDTYIVIALIGILGLFAAMVRGPKQQ